MICISRHSPVICGSVGLLGHRGKKFVSVKELRSDRILVRNNNDSIEADEQHIGGRTCCVVFFEESQRRRGSLEMQELCKQGGVDRKIHFFH